MSSPQPRNVLISHLCSVSALVLLATDDSDEKYTFEQMIKKEIEALRKQLEEPDTSSSVPSHVVPGPVLVIPRGPQRPSQAHGNQVPKEDGVVDFEFYKRDIQSRAKAAVAHGRSFIA